MVRRLLGALGFAMVLGCASPTLPLPPPSIPTIEAGSETGHVRLVSTRGAEPYAIVVIVNRNPSLADDARVFGTQADGVGTWDADVAAVTGDYLDITQESGNTRSPSITVRVP